MRAEEKAPDRSVSSVLESALTERDAEADADATAPRADPPPCVKLRMKPAEPSIESAPVPSTGEGTRRVRLVRGKRRGVSV